MGILIIILFVIFCLVILSIPSGLTFLLYRYLRKKGQTHRKVGLAIFLITTVLMIIYSVKFFMDGAGFGPKNETVIINQNIGGKLICESVYNADIHSWQYEIDYVYKDKTGVKIPLGDGTYYGREWKKDEQLIKFGNWIILKTGSWYGSDRIILKNLQTKSSNKFDFNDKFIENDSLWKAQRILSLLDYCCSESFVDKISKNTIIVKYKFRTDKTLTNLYDKRFVTYKIDGITGSIKMIKIEK